MMANYQDWNNEIYNYFFNENPEGIRCLFYVDEKLINNIGEKLGEEKPLESFCKCVLNEICEERPRNKGIYGFKIENIEKIKDNIPKQTALIAFFVYAATIMVNEGNFSSNAYWGSKIKKIIAKYKNISEEQVDRNILYANEYDYCSELFDNFEQSVESQGYKIKFQKLYKRGNNDIVGRIISQAIISDKDRRLLNKQFEKINKNNNGLSDYDYKKIINQSGYSKGFQKAIAQEELKEKIKDIIKDLYNYFLENGDDYIDTINGKKLVISPKLRYYSDSGEFLLEFKQKKNVPEEFEEYKKDRDVFYKYIEPEEVSMCNKFYIENEEIKYLQNDYTKEYILLVAEEQGDYIENFSANVSDNVVIIAGRLFFNKYRKNLNKIFDKDIKEKSLGENNLSSLYILGATCKCPDSDFNIKSGDTIKLLKGLKNGQKDEYLQNAGPILNINKSNKNDIKRKNTNGKVFIINNKNSSTDYSIDNGSFQPYKIPIRLNDKQIGPHCIKVKHVPNKNYEIKYEFEERDQEFIYNYFQDGIFVKTNGNGENPNFINGCYIENLFLSNKPGSINEDKKTYINNIIKAFDMRLNNSKLYKPQLYGLKQRYMKELEA